MLPVARILSAIELAPSEGRLHRVSQDQLALLGLLLSSTRRHEFPRAARRVEIFVGVRVGFGGAL